ncbi:MAG: hypothetical protein VYC39_01640 [Myxococcota bacterium]|nr:hypothetical protein [Myxococcota bacterium]
MNFRFITIVIMSLTTQLGCSQECMDDETSGSYLYFSEPGQADNFFHHPWPSDARRRPDKTIGVNAWPNPTESSTLEEYLAVIGDHTYGYGLNSATYFTSSSPINESVLTKSPLEYVSYDAPFFLVDIDPESSEYGRLRPLSTKYYKEKTTYLPKDSLAVLPPFGLTLRSNTTYALVATTALKDSDNDSFRASKNFHNAINTACNESAPASLTTLLEPLRSFIASENLSTQNMVAATVFTTQDVLGEMQRIQKSAESFPPLTIQNLKIEEEREDVVMSSAVVQMPSIQAGDVPYQQFSDGGAVFWQPDGSAGIHHYEKTRISFILPLEREMPQNGWPVVLMSHGTGATYKSAYNRKIASSLGREGIAIISYDPTLHGPRDPTNSDERLTFFNLFNILAARDNVRQAAVDLMMLSQLLKDGFSLPSRVTRRNYDAKFDTSRMGFLGHSQGGLAGSPFLSVDSDIKVAVFSGTSGVLNITLQERKDPVDFEELLRGLLAIPAEEVVDDFHPVLNLIQTFIDPADPISYGSNYLHSPAGGVLRDYLFIEGFKDSASPARGHEALASAVGAPLVAPFFRVPYAAELVGPSPVEAPTSGNILSEGGNVTVGLIQYPEQDHWPIFDDLDANRRYTEFIRSALFDGRAQIIASGN